MAVENGTGTQHFRTPQVIYKVVLKEIEYTKGVIRMQWQKDKIGRHNATQKLKIEQCESL